MVLTRRDFLRRAAAGGLLATAAVTGYGLIRQTASPRVVEKVLAFPALPKELEGFRICQISDIHLGMWMTQDEMIRAFEAAAGALPDLVVLTGDLVDDNPGKAKLYHEPLGIFQKVPHGVYAILGNHDHYTGASMVAMELGKSLNMLVQRRVTLPEAPMTIVGLDDRGTRGSWLGRRGQNVDPDPDILTFSGVLGAPFRSGDFNLLLNHRPEGYRQASRLGFDLYLAGHTHGGQYQAPWCKEVNLAAVFYKYSSGLYHDHPTWLNVNRGLGSVGLPFRVVAWPEIDLITLTEA
jgi:predicted MPP superfamily phosphohydrolase